MKRALFIPLLIALTSCAHLTQEQCRSINWQNEGCTQLNLSGYQQGRELFPTQNHLPTFPG